MRRHARTTGHPCRTECVNDSCVKLEGLLYGCNRHIFFVMHPPPCRTKYASTHGWRWRSSSLCRRARSGWCVMSRGTRKGPSAAYRMAWSLACAAAPKQRHSDSQPATKFRFSKTWPQQSRWLSNGQRRVQSAWQRSLHDSAERLAETRPACA